MADTSRKDSKSGNKPRKSKNELIAEALGVYLKQRNYAANEKFKRSDLVLSQNNEKLFFNKMINEDLSRVNSFLFSNVLCLSHNRVDEHFNKFVQFVKNQNGFIQEELSNLFGPLLSHLYIEMLKIREWKPALEFLKKYSYLIGDIKNLNAPLPNKVNGCSVNTNFHEENGISIETEDETGNGNNIVPTITSQILFTSEDTGNPIQNEFKEIIQNLSMCSHIEQLKNYETITFFRSAKYVIEISLTTMNILKRFLEKKGHVIILNILQVWIHFDIKDLKDEKEPNILSETVAEPIKTKMNSSDDVNIFENGTDHNKLRKSINNDNVTKMKTELKTEPDITNINPDNVPLTYLGQLKYTALKLHKLDAPIRQFCISDTQKKITNVSIDSEGCHMAAGFDTSFVKLWQLNSNPYRGRNMYEKFQFKLCPWSTNYSGEQEEEEEDSEDELKSDKNFSNKFNPETYFRIHGKKKREEDFMNEKYEGNSFDDCGGVLLRGHSRGITDVMFSTNHPVLYTASKDHTVRLWKASNYACASIYRGHNYPVWCISENPVGMYFATGSKDFTARLWSIEREFPVVTYVGHTQDVECIAFHPNGNYLATGSSDSTIRFWSVTEGKLVRVFTECKFPVRCISFSPDGKYLTAGGEETKIRVFDLAAGTQLFQLKDHTSPVTSICWNKLGNKIASCCSDGSARVWDIMKTNATNEPQASSSNSSPSSTISNKLICSLSGCNRALKVFFNSADFVTCIGTTH